LRFQAQNLENLADKMKLFKFNEDGHALFLFVLKGKTQLMKATTLEQLQSTFDTISAEVNERDKQLRSSNENGVNQFGKQMFDLFVQLTS
jgi:hypothetical protein